MKTLCPLSSIEFEVTYFSKINYSSRETIHPIFHLPQRDLISLTRKWANNEFSDTETYLLYLALLKSTRLVNFKCAALPSPHTIEHIYQNYEKLLKIIVKLGTVSDAQKHIPAVSLNPETRDLTNSKVWIQVWEEAYDAWAKGYRTRSDWQVLAARESTLERMLKNPNLPQSAYIGNVATWASLAGDFPTFRIIHPLTKKEVSLDSYWMEMITWCVHPINVYKIDRKDFNELLEFCQEKIEVGTIQASALFKALSQAEESFQNWKGLGKPRETAFSVLSESEISASTELKQIKAIITSAGDAKPEEKDFVKKIDYLRAKLAYELKQKELRESQVVEAPKVSKLPQKPAEISGFLNLPDAPF